MGFDSPDVRQGGRTLCGHCNRPVLDDTTDFGNGLLLRSVCGGIQFGIYEDGTYEWRDAVLTRAELRAFLDGRS